MTVIVIMTTSNVMVIAFDYTFIFVIATADVVTKITLITILTYYMQWTPYLLHVFFFIANTAKWEPYVMAPGRPRERHAWHWWHSTPGNSSGEQPGVCSGFSPFICLSHFQLSRQVDVKGHFFGGSSSLFGWITITVSENKRKEKNDDWNRLGT